MRRSMTFRKWSKIFVRRSLAYADELCIDVIDDGKGFPGDLTGGGLADLRQRAEAIGGTLTIGDGPGGGTRLRWAAPLTSQSVARTTW
jgi:signal transduction histidine kinase